MAARTRNGRTQRIVSLAPNVTSILLELGADHELVGVTKWCKQIAPVGTRPQVGDCWKLDIDAVMRLKPTLLIGSVPFAPKAIAAILERPVPFLAINPRSLADIEEDIRLLGRVVGRSRQAQRLIREMRRGFAHIARRGQAFAKGPRPRVYCEAWPNPRISSPRWVAEIVKLAGGRSIVQAGKRVTDEEIAVGKPDVIVLAWAATGDRAKREQAFRNRLWQNIPAVKSGRVLVIRDELLNTPGPPLLEGALAILRAIHPQAATQRTR